MPEFDPSRLSVFERLAWLERLKRDGAAGITARFATVVRGVRILRAEGRRPVEITATILGEYYDAEESNIPVSIFRSQAIKLAGAMVRQALDPEPRERLQNWSRQSSMTRDATG